MKNQSLRKLLLAFATYVALSSVLPDRVEAEEKTVTKSFISGDGTRLVKVKVETNKRGRVQAISPSVSSTSTVASVTGSGAQSVTQLPDLLASQQSTVAPPEQEVSSSTGSHKTTTNEVVSSSLSISTPSDFNGEPSQQNVEFKSTTRASNPADDQLDAASHSDTTSPVADLAAAASSPHEAADDQGELSESRSAELDDPASSPLEGAQAPEDEAESSADGLEQTHEGVPLEGPGEEDYVDSPSPNDESHYESEPVDERVEETYIDNSDPDDPKQVHHVKEVHSSMGPNGGNYSQTDSKTSNSIGANPNYRSKQYSKVSSSSSSSYSDGGLNNYPQPRPNGAYDKSGKGGRRYRYNHKNYKPAQRLPGYFNPNLRYYRPFPAMPPMTKAAYRPKLYPIFPPIPNLPHAPKIPPAWLNLANRGIGYGYAYPPAYAAASASAYGKPSKTGGGKAAYAYANASSGKGAYSQAKKAKKSNRRRRRHLNRRHQNSQEVETEPIV